MVWFLILETGVIEKPSGNIFDPVYRVASSSGGDDDEVFDLDD